MRTFDSTKETITEVEVGDIVDAKPVTKVELARLSSDPGRIYRDEDGKLCKARSFKSFWEHYDD
jgi:hypothetical protein